MFQIVQFLCPSDSYAKRYTRLEDSWSLDADHTEFLTGAVFKKANPVKKSFNSSQFNEFSFSIYPTILLPKVLKISKLRTSPFEPEVQIHTSNTDLTR